MTATATAPTTRVEDIAPGKIKPHPRNVRTNLGDLTELTASIKAKGLLQPLVVAPSGSSYLLIAGHRRLAAAMAAKVPTLTCVIRDDLDTEAAQLEAMLIENCHRTDLTPVEEGDAYEQLLAFDGYNVKTIAERTGRDAKTIRSRVAIAKLPERSRAAAASGQITLEQAARMAELASTAPDEIPALEEVFGTDNFPFRLQRALNDAAEAKRVAKLRAALVKSGVKVIDPPKGFPYAMGKVRALAHQLESWSGTYELKITVDEHKACEHHAAVIRNGKTAYVCTNAAVHDERNEPDDDGAEVGGSTSTTTTVRRVETPEEIEGRRQADEARAQHQENADAAAALRKAHVELLLRAPLNPALLVALAGCVVTTTAVCGFEPDPEGALDWLGVGAARDWDEDWWALRTQVPAKGADRVLLATVASQLEQNFGPSWWEGETARVDAAEAAWLQALIVGGYVLSDWERGLLDAYDAKVTADAAAAGDQDAGDVDGDDGES